MNHILHISEQKQFVARVAQYLQTASALLEKFGALGMRDREDNIELLHQSLELLRQAKKELSEQTEPNVKLDVYTKSGPVLIILDKKIFSLSRISGRVKVQYAPEIKEQIFSRMAECSQELGEINSQFRVRRDQYNASGFASGHKTNIIGSSKGKGF